MAKYRVKNSKEVVDAFQCEGDPQTFERLPSTWNLHSYSAHYAGGRAVHYPAVIRGDWMVVRLDWQHAEI